MTCQNTATCPVCNGTLRQIANFDRDVHWATYVSEYDKDTHTVPCGNCGGQYQFGGGPTGKVAVRIDTGEACEHEYEGWNAGRCYMKYACKHCGDSYSIDSSD